MQKTGISIENKTNFKEIPKTPEELMMYHENFEHENLLSSSQKPDKLALQRIKACKTFEHFQVLVHACYRHDTW